MEVWIASAAILLVLALAIVLGRDISMQITKRGFSIRIRQSDSDSSPSDLNIENGTNQADQPLLQEEVQPDFGTKDQSSDQEKFAE